MSINSIFNNTSPFHVPGIFIHILPSYNRYHIYIYSKFKYLTLQCFCIKNLSRTISLKHLTKKKTLKILGKKGQCSSLWVMAHLIWPFCAYIRLSYGAFILTILHLHCNFSPHTLYLYLLSQLLILIIHNEQIK